MPAGKTLLIPAQQYGVPVTIYARDMPDANGAPIGSITLVNQSAESTAYLFTDSGANSFPIQAVGPDSYLTMPLFRREITVMVVPNSGTAVSAGTGAVTIIVTTEAMSASAGTFIGGSQSRNANYARRGSGNNPII